MGSRGGCCKATHRIVRWWRKPWYRKLDPLLSNEWCGSWVPPLDNRSKTFRRDDQTVEVIAIQEDGFHVYLGYPHAWHHFYDRGLFRRMALWFLWQEAWHGWFGLRQRLWFWCLHKKVAENKRSADCWRRRDGKDGF